MRTIEPQQDHVAAEHRCPPITISAERAQALAKQDAAVEQAVDRLIADQDVAIDPKHDARQRSAEPVPFKLGRNTFSLYRNFFYFQNAPSEVPRDGTVSLSLQWPCMEPLPQGFNFADDQHASMRAVLITVRHLDPERITVPIAMQRSTVPLDPENKEQLANPLENLDLRIEGDAVHGQLTPYFADLDAVERYLRDRHPSNARAYSRENARQLAKDWYIRPGPDNYPLSVIKCDSREIADGLIVEGNTVKDDPATQRRASCNHQFALPDRELIVEMSYARAFLPDWLRIEERVSALLRPIEP